MRPVIAVSLLIALSLPALADEEHDFLPDNLPSLTEEAPPLPDAQADAEFPRAA